MSAIVPLLSYMLVYCTVNFARVQLGNMLARDPVAVNNFTQSAQSEHGPKKRESKPSKISLLGALYDKIDQNIALLHAATNQTQVPEVRPVAPNPLLKAFGPSDQCGFLGFLVMPDITAIACASASMLQSMPQRWRDLITFQRIVTRFAWGRSLDALMSQVTTRMSQKMSIVASVYQYFELTGKYPAPPIMTRMNFQCGPEMTLICLAVVHAAVALSTWIEDDQDRLTDAISQNFKQVARAIPGRTKSLKQLCNVMVARYGQTG